VSYVAFGFDASIGIIIVLMIAGSMTLCSRFWAEYIIAFGFWERFAKDFKEPLNSQPAIAFLGWVLLLLITWLIIYSVI